MRERIVHTVTVSEDGFYDDQVQETLYVLNTVFVYLNSDVWSGYQESYKL